jgi:hypothetical protein
VPDPIVRVGWPAAGAAPRTADRSRPGLAAARSRVRRQASGDRVRAAGWRSRCRSTFRAAPARAWARVRKTELSDPSALGRCTGGFLQVRCRNEKTWIGTIAESRQRSKPRGFRARGESGRWLRQRPSPQTALRIGRAGWSPGSDAAQRLASGRAGPPGSSTTHRRDRPAPRTTPDLLDLGVERWLGRLSPSAFDAGRAPSRTAYGRWGRQSATSRSCARRAGGLGRGRALSRPPARGDCYPALSSSAKARRSLMC